MRTKLWWRVHVHDWPHVRVVELGNLASVETRLLSRGELRLVDVAILVTNCAWYVGLLV